jgi:hypothetical protein
VIFSRRRVTDVTAWHFDWRLALLLVSNFAVWATCAYALVQCVRGKPWL